MPNPLSECLSLSPPSSGKVPTTCWSCPRTTALPRLHARLDALIEGHEERLARVRQELAQPKRAIDVFSALFRRRVGVRCWAWRPARASQPQLAHRAGRRRTRRRCRGRGLVPKTLKARKLQKNARRSGVSRKFHDAGPHAGHRLPRNQASGRPVARMGDAAVCGVRGRLAACGAQPRVRALRRGATHAALIACRADPRKVPVLMLQEASIPARATARTRASLRCANCSRDRAPGVLERIAILFVAGLHVEWARAFRPLEPAEPEWPEGPAGAPPRRISISTATTPGGCTEMRAMLGLIRTWDPLVCADCTSPMVRTFSPIFRCRQSPSTRAMHACTHWGASCAMR